MNVLNKTTGQPGLGSMFPNNSDGFDDGFVPPAGLPGSQHARSDSTWRINGGVGGLQNAPYTADLAQAQAQLQSLQQFRAAAGGHHHKMPSFSFPNMLPNMMAANMMGLGLGGMNILQQQHQQFQSQLQQQSNQPQRKSLFAPYLPQASLPPLLAAGKLVVGILRVNKRNRSDAYVATEVLDADIYICGSKDRNRALEGDIVAVELLDVDEVWGTKKEKEEKKRKKEENSAYDLKGTAVRKNDKKKDDVEVEGQGLMLFEDEECVTFILQTRLYANPPPGLPTKSSRSSLVTSSLLSSACPASSSPVPLVYSAPRRRPPRRSRKLSAVNARVTRVTNPVAPSSAPRSSGSSRPTNVCHSSLSPLSRLLRISCRTPRHMPTSSLLLASSVT